MTATLDTQIDQIRSEVRRVTRLADDLAAAAVDLSELWDHEAVHEEVRSAFRAQDSASSMVSALTRLEEVAG